MSDSDHPRGGVVAAAEGGTLFLDEIDALPVRAQVTLLRFLQEKSYRPVGSSREQRSNVRIVAATSPRLRELLSVGAFRDDLAFWLTMGWLAMMGTDRWWRNRRRRGRAGAPRRAPFPLECRPVRRSRGGNP